MKKFHYIKLCLFSLTFPGVLAFIALNSANTHAAGLSVSLSGNNTFSLTPGQEGSNAQTITISNNYISGYTMTLEATNNNNELINTTDSTKKIPSISKAIPSTDPAPNNTWYYQLSGNNIISTLTNKKLPIPTTTPTTLATTNTPTPTTTPDEYNLTIGAKVDTTTPAGVYKNNLVIRVVSNPIACSANQICYDDNNANSDTTMDRQTINATDTEATLWPSNFQYNGGGYGFAGWNTKADGTGTSFGPMQTLDSTNNQAILDEIKANGLTLYAMWVQSTGNLQNYSASTCASMTTNQVIALTDTRDNNTYAISKLADGNCWMIENLRLDNTAELTTQNTNNPLSYNGIVTIQNDDGDTTNHLSPSSSSWCNQQGDAGCINQSKLNTDNTTNPIPIMNDPNANIYSYGNYYNWYSATAGNGTYSMTHSNVAGDICPIGWHLPTGDTGGEFSALDITMGGTGSFQGTSEASNRWRTYPVNNIYSGLVYSSSFNDRGAYGGFWSSTSYLSDTAYELSFLDSYVYPGTYGSYRMYNGFSVRCMLSTTYTINYDSNGGTGSMNSQTVSPGATVNLTANTFTPPTNKSYQAFLGWNTATDGSGTSYTNEQSVTDLAQAGQSITLYAQWGCPTNSICYDPNGATAEGTTASPTMSSQSIASTATEATLWPSNFKRLNYGFAGWNTKADGTGTSYGPNQTITDTATLNNIKNGLVLYAMWVQNQGDMDNFTPAMCAAMNIGDITARKDWRDKNTYAIAKLADGKCWMIENLRLSNTRVDTGGAASFSYTNNPASGFSLGNPTNSSWCISNDAACMDQSLYNTVNTQDTIATMTTPNSNVYSYGNYYNWYTATAGNGTYSMTSGSTAGDICPSGWHLPTGNAGGEFSALDIAMGGTGGYQSTTEASNRWRKYPNNFIYSGHWYSSSPYVRSTYGYYWSSTANGSRSVAGILLFNSSDVYPGTNTNGKYYGNSVRCVLSANKSKITYNPNGATATGTTASPSMGDQTIASTDTEVTLWASNFKRLEYGFAGWSTVPLDPDSSTFQADLNRAASNGQVYGPNQTITDTNIISNIKNNGITFYAIWVKNAGWIDDFTPTMCSNMSIGDVTARKDYRDKNVYAVAKLADGKCWMIENLRLSNTRVDNGSAANLSFTNNPASGFTLGSPTNTSWCTNSDATCLNQSLYNTTNTQNTISNMTNPDSNVYSYGNYYNWYSATAGNGTYSTTSGNTAGDICPEDWHLPTGNTGGDLSTLDIALGGTGATQTGAAGANQSAKWRTFPNNYVHSGEFQPSSPSILNRSSVAAYSSSTTLDNTQTYALDIFSGEVWPGTGWNYKRGGYTVRCAISP